MAIVISVANSKGGVGKTMTVSAVAAILSREYNKKVLLIDQDAQRNLDMLAGRGVAISRRDTESLNILSVLEEKCSIREAIVHTDIGDLIRSTNQLYGWAGTPVITEQEFNGLKDKPEEVVKFLEQRFREKRYNGDISILKNKLAEIKDEYDYIIIDTNPTLMLLTLSSLYASDAVIIPAFSEKSSAEAVIEMVETVRSLAYYNPGLRLEVAGMLMTKYDGRSRACHRHDKKYADLADKLKIKLFETRIRASARAAETVEAGMDIVRYDPNGNTSQDYHAFTRELLARIDEIKEGWNNG